MRILSSTWTLRCFLGDFLGTLRQGEEHRLYQPGETTLSELLNPVAEVLYAASSIRCWGNLREDIIGHERLFASP
jgi:hypothetical protein